MVHSYYKNDFEHKIKRREILQLGFYYLFYSWGLLLACWWGSLVQGRQSLLAGVFFFIWAVVWVMAAHGRKQLSWRAEWCHFIAWVQAPPGVKSRSLVINSLVLGTRGLLVVICLAQTGPLGTWNYWHKLGQVLSWPRRNCHSWPFFS